MYVKAYHVTSVDNLDTILSNGIYSRSYMEKNGSFRDIAERGALSNHRFAMIDNYSVDHFARCFFNPLPPMYYMRKDTEKLCILELHIPIAVISKFLGGQQREFHNIKIEGARWPYPRIYKASISAHKGNLNEIEVHNLNNIRWDSSKAAFDANPQETKAKRGAEMAIFEHIPSKYIKRVYRTESEIESLVRYRDLGKPQIVEGSDD